MDNRIFSRAPVTRDINDNSPGYDSPAILLLCNGINDASPAVRDASDRSEDDFAEGKEKNNLTNRVPTKQGDFNEDPSAEFLQPDFIDVDYR